ncbi:MAG: TonB family protein [Chitinivibrionales bacterium]|nr:TonB family protein [Chitinivibrionales bacterium]
MWTIMQRDKNGSTSFAPHIMISLLMHLALFVLIPWFSRFVRKPSTFKRPQTFQLVQLPVQKSRPPRIRQSPQKAPAIKKPRAKAPVKTRKPARAKPEPRPKPQPQNENLKELEKLLGDVPVPSRLTSLSRLNIPWYLIPLRSKIESFWRPAIENEKLSVTVHFTILRSGALGEVAVRKTSGNKSLDMQAVNAVRRAAPFAKLPPTVKENRLELAITFYPIRK